MSFEISRKDAAETLTHLDLDNIGTRAIPAFPVLVNDDEGKWGMWLPGPDGKLVRMKDGEPVEGSYLAKGTMDDEDDVYFRFIHVAVQHLSWPGPLEDAAEALRHDIHNLAATVKTMQNLHRAGQEWDENVRRPAQVQLEYIITTCRSMYDLAQIFLIEMHNRIRFSDAELEKRRKGETLPRRFAKMAIKAHDRPLTEEEIADQYALPDPWVRFYAQEADFLFSLRHLRDDIIHKGRQTPWIMADKRRLLISADHPAVKRLYEYPESHLLPGNPNRLGALTSLVGFIINRTLKMLDNLVEMLTAFELPPEVAPGYHVFMRDPHLHCLGEGELPVLPEHDPWYPERNEANGTDSAA